MNGDFTARKGKSGGRVHASRQKCVKGLRKPRKGALKDGGADKDRTCDLLNAIQALYQLSYDPIQSGEQSKDSSRFVKTIFNSFANFLNFRLRPTIRRLGPWAIPILAGSFLQV
jgi:hypothetical protein